MPTQSKTREYTSWYHMVRRCHVPADIQYPGWGGRGIRVCRRWRKSFTNFLKDMGPRPMKMSLGRINNNGHYTPRNCRWETPTQQLRNQKDTKWITYRGEKLCQQEWAERLGINNMTLKGRLDRGWPLAKALTEPARYGRRILRGDYKSRCEDAARRWEAARAKKLEKELEATNG